jgi:hypothetical protein
VVRRQRRIVVTFLTMILISGCERYSHIEHEGELHIFDSWTGEVTVFRQTEEKEVDYHLKELKSAISKTNINIRVRTQYRGGEMYYSIFLYPSDNSEDFDGDHWNAVLYGALKKTSYLQLRLLDANRFKVTEVKVNSYSSIVQNTSGGLSSEGRFVVSKDDYLAITHLEPVWSLDVPKLEL